MTISESSAKKTKRILVIGAVAAGTSAAAKARRNDEDAEIVIYDMDRFISYSGCGLPYYISGLVDDINKLTPRDPSFFQEKYNIEVRILHQVESIDPESHTLIIRNLPENRVFTDNYDVLIIATGASPVRLPIPGADLPHVFTLRNPADAVAVRSFIDQQHPRSAAVIGTGFIGLEMADSLSQHGIEITCIEKLPNICPSLDPDMASHLHKHLHEKGIRIESGRTATVISDSEVHLDNGQTVPADMIIMSVGIRPNTALAIEAGVVLGSTGAIAVDEQLRTNIPDIYACGDCAENFFSLTGNAFYRPLGSTANKTGRITGDIVTGGSLTHRGVLGTGIFETFGMSVASTGLTEKDCREQGFDITVIHNIKPDRPDYMDGKNMVIKAIADRRTHNLLGVQIVGFGGVDKRIDVFVTAMTARLRVEDLFHLDLSYAPPFSTTKDPVMYTGMILENALDRGHNLITSEELARRPDGELTILDVRIAEQYARGHLPGAKSAPLQELRDITDKLDPDKTVITYCNKGNTGNAAQNILLNRGFKEVYNLSGGYTQYATQPTKNKEDPKMTIKILGGGCKYCAKLVKNTEEALIKLGLKAEIIKVTDFAEIAAMGVMQTPALVINDAVVSAGKVLTSKEIAVLLKK